MCMSIGDEKGVVLIQRLSSLRTAAAFFSGFFRNHEKSYCRESMVWVLTLPRRDEQRSEGALQRVSEESFTLMAMIFDNSR